MTNEPSIAAKAPGFARVVQSLCLEGLIGLVCATAIGEERVVVHRQS